jgi:lactoylglutathione lyase
VITDLFPIVSTANLPRALGFYRDLLGGTVTYESPGPDGEPGYVGLAMGSTHLGIVRVPEFEPMSQRAIALWVYVDDCDAAIERMRGAGVMITEEPVDQPWGERVAHVLDPDGNEVIVGAKLG